MAVTGPGAEEAGSRRSQRRRPAAPSPDSGRINGSRSVATRARQHLGHRGSGVTVRSIDGRPTVTSVRPGSSAARHRIAAGIHRHAHRRPGPRCRSSARPSRTSSGTLAAPGRGTVRAAPKGDPLCCRAPWARRSPSTYLDNADRPGQVILERDVPPGPLRQIGYLPPLYPEVRISEQNGVGVIAFNMFLLDPLLNDIKQAVDRFRDRHMRGVILDLRGNPGGLGAMAIPVASEFVATPDHAGHDPVSHLRPDLHRPAVAGAATLRRSAGHPHRRGDRVRVGDTGGGLQEAGRARVVGDATLGAVLPSVVEALPHRAVLQVVVADFKTPEGDPGRGARRSARSPRRRKSPLVSRGSRRGDGRRHGGHQGGGRLGPTRSPAKRAGDAPRRPARRRGAARSAARGELRGTP